MRGRWLTALLMAALALNAVVVAGAAAQSRFPLRTGPDPMLPPCTCRADGRVFDMGETICLRTADGARIARCVMVENMPSWSPTQTPCPAASLRLTPRG